MSGPSYFRRPDEGQRSEIDKDSVTSTSTSVSLDLTMLTALRTLRRTKGHWLGKYIFTGASVGKRLHPSVEGKKVRMSVTVM